MDALSQFRNNWFVRNEEAPTLDDAEAAFVRAALGAAPKRWDGAPDDDRMAALLAEHPKVLQRIGKRLLVVAIGKRGCGSAVRLLLANGVPFEQDASVYNVLHEAAWAGAEDTLRAVFESGVADATCVSVKKPHVGWPDNLSLMYWAAQGGFTEVAELLIRHGVGKHHALPIKGNGERGYTSLHEAAAPSRMAERHDARLQIARLLIADGAPYDVYAACGLDDAERLQELVEADPAVVGAADPYGMTPVHWAARASSMRCLGALLERGVDVNARNKAARVPLHLAAETTPLGDAAEDARQADVIRLLAEHGAELNAQDKKGRTPLHRATYEGQVDAVEALLAAGADPSIPNKSGKNAFAIARKAAKHYKQRA